MPGKRKLTGAAAAAVARKKLKEEQAIPADVQDKSGTVSAGRKKAVAKSASAAVKVAATKPVSNRVAGATHAKSAAPAPTSPAKTRAIQSNPPAPAAPSSPSPDTHPAFLPAVFDGKFDLFSTKLEDLSEEHLPEGATAPQYASLHATLLKQAASGDYSARIALRDGGKAGKFACDEVCNVLTREPLEPIYLVGGKTRKVAFSERESAHESGVGEGQAYVANMVLDVGPGGDRSEIAEGMGFFKMRKVWDGGEGKELFEGFCKLKLTYGKPIRGKGRWGEGGIVTVMFWAIRARKDWLGMEDGIDAGDGTFGAEEDEEDWDDGEEYEDEYYGEGHSDDEKFWEIQRADYWGNAGRRGHCY
ncbi:hypothetical protein FA95DRAFT_1683892 [Auriscalpium vulgare]|uniref:Uncharacterized protein n=1 Tax=Auriscalpium vulgare TaxID=40419 RepID=A0ACB8R8J0_9AGAM|nr:hypothetical protein FA95DRAFT_1683892 [Auriscalpium vulgare]